MDEARFHFLLASSRTTTRDEAAEILQAGDTVVRYIRRALGSIDRLLESRAVVLAAQLRHPSLMEPVAQKLQNCARLRDDGSPAGYSFTIALALAAFGEPAIPILAETARQARRDHVRKAAVRGLLRMACQSPELRNLVGPTLMDLLRESHPPGACIHVAKALTFLDWREAMPMIGEAIEAGRIPADLFPRSALEGWALSPRLPEKFEDVADEDLMDLFPPRHEAAFFDYERDLTEACNQALKEEIGEAAIERDLAALRAPRPAAGVGRNEPCPCGSGRKYKKCCAQAAQADPLRLRIAHLEWPAIGYRMLPSEQLARLPAEEVTAHLDILAMSASELKRRLANETNDYLLWAGAQRQLVLHRGREAQALATLVAASNGDHPALCYPAIETIAHLDLIAATHSDAAVRDAILRGGHLPEFWEEARNLAQHDAQGAEELFLQALRAHPRNWWTVVAMASALYDRPHRVLPHLQQALEEAEAGRSVGHPRLPDRPCPPEVLRGWVEAVEQRAARLHHEASRWTQLTDGTLPLKWVLPWTHLRAWWAQGRSPGTQEERRVLTGILQALGEREESGPTPSAILQAPRQDSDARFELLWIAAQPWNEDHMEQCQNEVLDGLAPPGTSLLEMVYQTACDECPESFALAVGPWSGWTALLLAGTGYAADVVTSLAVRLEEGKEFLARPVETPWNALVSTGETDSLQRLRSRLRPPRWRQSTMVEPPPVPAGEPVEAGELLRYVHRVLLRLLRMRKIGAAHTALEHFMRGVPKRFRGNMKDVLDAMLAQGWIRYKPTAKEAHISLEPTAMPAIWELLHRGIVPEGRLQDVLAPR
ncbi:MAG: SEC-C metal-binding domain-containing protein [Candidatus Xenobia bacterium]